MPSSIGEKPSSANSIPCERREDIFTENFIEEKIAHSFKMFLQEEGLKIREKLCDNCDGNVAPDPVSAIVSQMTDAIMNLQNENRQMRDESRHMQQLWEKHQQDNRASLDKAHEKLDRILSWIDSGSTAAKQLSDKSGCDKSDLTKPVKDVSNQHESAAAVMAADVGPVGGRGELVWPIDNFMTRRHQLTIGASRCFDSPEFLSAPTGYRLQLRLWMSDTGVEMGVRMLESRETVNGVHLWPISFQVTIGVVDAAHREQFLFQEKLVIEYKNPSFSSPAVVRFPSAQVTQVASRSDLVVIRCLAADFHCSKRVSGIF